MPVQSPESTQIDLSNYEGQTIMISGKINGYCIYSAEVIK